MKWFTRFLLILGIGLLGYAFYTSWVQTRPAKNSKEKVTARISEYDQKTQVDVVGERSAGWRRLPSDIKSELREIGFVPSTPSTGWEQSTMTDLKGDPVRLERLRGRWVLLNFWATWCPPCREEMPSLERLWEGMNKESFRLVTVNLMEKPDTVKNFVRDYELTFPVWIDTTGDVAEAFRVHGIPVTWLIDPGGRPVALLDGPRTWDDRNIVKLMDQLAILPEVNDKP